MTSGHLIFMPRHSWISDPSPWFHMSSWCGGHVWTKHSGWGDISAESRWGIDTPLFSLYHWFTWDSFQLTASGLFHMIYCQITFSSCAHIVNFWNTNMAFYVCPTIKIPLDYSSYPSSGEFTFSMILIWLSDMLAMPPSFETVDWKNKPSMCPLKTLKETEPRKVPLVKDRKSVV